MSAADFRTDDHIDNVPATAVVQVDLADIQIDFAAVAAAAAAGQRGFAAVAAAVGPISFAAVAAESVPHFADSPKQVVIEIETARGVVVVAHLVVVASSRPVSRMIATDSVGIQEDSVAVAPAPLRDYSHSKYPLPHPQPPPNLVQPAVPLHRLQSLPFLLENKHHPHSQAYPQHH